MGARFWIGGIVTGFGLGLVSVRLVGGGWWGRPRGVILPLQVFYVVVGVYGEDVGFVEVVRRAVGVEGADAEAVFRRAGSRW